MLRIPIHRADQCKAQADFCDGPFYCSSNCMHYVYMWINTATLKSYVFEFEVPRQFEKTWQVSTFFYKNHSTLNVQYAHIYSTQTPKITNCFQLVLGIIGLVGNLFGVVRFSMKSADKNFHQLMRALGRREGAMRMRVNRCQLFNTILTKTAKNQEVFS